VNVRLRAELEQACLKVVEAERHENSVRSGYTRLEGECEVLHNDAEALKHEKAEAETIHEAGVATVHAKFWDYHVHHCRKLHDLRFHLKKAANECGAGCLPYLGKNNTISDITGWFDNEIKALPATIAKANNFFVCYALVGVLPMLYDND
jgi:hypothetical protein